MDCYLIVGNDIDLSKIDFSNSYVVGLDHGAFKAYENNIKLDKIIGDFDSCSEEEYQKLVGYAPIEKLNVIKDDTDTYHAIEQVKDYDRIFLLGAIQGKRIEHFIANFNLLNDYPNLIIKDDNSEIRRVSNNEVFSNDEYYFYSFFALEEIKDLCLSNFKYNLKNYNMKPFDSLGVSNELRGDGKVSFSSGKLVVIKSKLDRR